MSTINTIHRCFCNHTIAPLGKFECMAYVRGNVAYALDALPQTHVEAVTGTPWAQSTIYLCGTHHNIFVKGKALALTNTINTTVQEDNIMNTTTIHTDDYDADDNTDICCWCDHEQSDCRCPIEDVVEARLRQSEIEKFNRMSKEDAMVDVIAYRCDGCGAPDTDCICHLLPCKCCGQYFQNEVECACYFDVCVNCTTDMEFKNLYAQDFIAGYINLIKQAFPKEETMTTTNNTNAVIKNQMDQMVLCGNCKNYHHTVAEVKDCYRNNGKITHESAPTNTTTVKDPENYKWFATMPEAISFAKGKDASVKHASNGNGVVVHLR